MDAESIIVTLKVAFESFLDSLVDTAQVVVTLVPSGFAVPAVGIPVAVLFTSFILLVAWHFDYV